MLIRLHTFSQGRAFLLCVGDIHAIYQLEDKDVPDNKGRSPFPKGSRIWTHPVETRYVDVTEELHDIERLIKEKAMKKINDLRNRIEQAIQDLTNLTTTMPFFETKEYMDSLETFKEATEYFNELQGISFFTEMTIQLTKSLESKDSLVVLLTEFLEALDNYIPIFYAFCKLLAYEIVNFENDATKTFHTELLTKISYPPGVYNWEIAMDFLRDREFKSYLHTDLESVYPFFIAHITRSLKKGLFKGPEVVHACQFLTQLNWIVATFEVNAKKEADKQLAKESKNPLVRLWSRFS